MKVSAKTKEHPVPIVVEVDIPSALAEKVKKYGEEVVNASSEDSLIITVQALMRRLMTEGKNKDGKVIRAALDQAGIQKAVSEWRPDVKTLVRQTAFEKASSSINKLTPEERAALLKQLTAVNAGQATAKPQVAAR